ncbi:MAG: nuclear transport factor 2 family protein, partial [Acidimicrobiia bacterium]
IATHARGCDRHDVALLSSTYHDDGIDEHGTATIPGPEYAAWANAAHAATSDAHLHNVTTHTCEIDGDDAHAESYVLVALLGKDGKAATMMCGRYIDRLERRDGAWKIAVRRSTVELAFTADASLVQSPFFTDLGYLKGTRDRDDLSYTRPLTIETAAERW